MFQEQIDLNRPLPVSCVCQPLGVTPSATFDAFLRMETGQPERSIADKINDPNRPTWEAYKVGVMIMIMMMMTMMMMTGWP
jgi:hypothetical protein